MEGQRPRSWFPVARHGGTEPGQTAGLDGKWLYYNGQAHYLAMGGQAKTMVLGTTHHAACPPEALIAGLQWLIDQGCLEEHGPLQTGYRLTPKGFAALQDV